MSRPKYETVDPRGYLPVTELEVGTVHAAGVSATPSEVYLLVTVAGVETRAVHALRDRQMVDDLIAALREARDDVFEPSPPAAGGP